MAKTILEYKRHIDKPDEVYQCDRVYQDQTTLILSYINARTYSVAGISIPPSSRTLALYLQGVEQVIWKIASPTAEFLGYLVHLTDPVEIHADYVSYKDLMLDIWQTPPGPPRLLDEDDLRSALSAGKITSEQSRHITNRAQELLSIFPQIINQAEYLFTLGLLNNQE